MEAPYKQTANSTREHETMLSEGHDKIRLPIKAGLAIHGIAAIAASHCLALGHRDRLMHGSKTPDAVGELQLLNLL